MRTAVAVVALSLALAACGESETAADRNVDPTTSGTGAGHLGAGPTDPTATGTADAAQDRAGQ